MDINKNDQKSPSHLSEGVQVLSWNGLEQNMCRSVLASPQVLLMSRCQQLYMRRTLLMYNHCLIMRHLCCLSEAVPAATYPVRGFWSVYMLKPKSWFLAAALCTSSALALYLLNLHYHCQKHSPTLMQRLYRAAGFFYVPL